MECFLVRKKLIGARIPHNFRHRSNDFPPHRIHLPLQQMPPIGNKRMGRMNKNFDAQKNMPPAECFSYLVLLVFGNQIVHV